jgi:DNA helicase HerA-like ATPase
MDAAFAAAMTSGYALSEPGIVIGSPMLAGELLPDVRVQVALSMLNRHGLIAGATGTGKTKTLQLLAGQLSDVGVPVFISDIKGDVTGIAAPGNGTDQRIRDRAASLHWNYAPAGHPVEFLSLSGALGAQVRATVHSFGPLLLGKVLGLNDTQTSILSLVFKYCDDNQLPLLDLPDLRTTLNYLASDEGKGALAEYGGMSPASLGVILRAIVSVEQQHADIFFGEPEFDVADLLRTNADGKGIVSVLELSDVMDKPAMFSTFMLWMLAQLYHTLPEAGDLPKPKLCFFFDEAHLLFDDASKALLDEIEQTARLIRSKGVGVFFVTQTPTDVPASVLAQLGSRVEHALRAFTPQDADNLKKTARTFPITTFYDVEETLTSLGIGEAFVTVLSPRGIPTPLAATRLIPPDSLMAALDPGLFRQMVAASPLQTKYGTPIDRQSAHEIITGRIQAARTAAAQAAEAAAGVSVGGQPVGADGRPMSPAEQRSVQHAETEAEYRRIRLEREAAQAQQRADRQAAADQRRAAKAAEAAAKRREREITTTVRTVGRVATSRTGQSIIRSVFGTLFGGKR